MARDVYRAGHVYRTKTKKTTNLGGLTVTTSDNFNFEVDPLPPLISQLTVTFAIYSTKDKSGANPSFSGSYISMAPGSASQGTSPTYQGSTADSNIPSSFQYQWIDAFTLPGLGSYTYTLTGTYTSATITPARN